MPPELPRWGWIHLLPEAKPVVSGLPFGINVFRSIWSFEIASVCPGIASFYHFGVYVFTVKVDKTYFTTVGLFASGIYFYSST